MPGRVQGVLGNQPGVAWVGFQLVDHRPLDGGQRAERPRLGVFAPGNGLAQRPGEVTAAEAAIVEARRDGEVRRRQVGLLPGEERCGAVPPRPEIDVEHQPADPGRRVGLDIAAAGRDRGGADAERALAIGAVRPAGQAGAEQIEHGLARIARDGRDAGRDGGVAHRNWLRSCWAPANVVTCRRGGAPCLSRVSEGAALALRSDLCVLASQLITARVCGVPLCPA